MQNDRNFTFLGSVDLKKFTISENKKQMQNNTTFEHRNPIQRVFMTQIDFIFPFSFETLVSHIQVELSDSQQFETVFDSLEIQASSLNNRGHYLQLINSNVSKENERIIYTGSAFTHSLKIGILVRSDWKKKLGRSSKEIQEGLEKIMSQTVADINVYGMAVNLNPSPVLLTKLLNISQSFKKYNLVHEAAETELLAALSLISARRFVQASELLRKVSKFYVERYKSNRTAIDFNKTERSWIKEQEDDSHTRTNFTSGRIIEGNKFLQKAAKIELLLAETISHPSLVQEKLESYHRCNAYASGNSDPDELEPDADMEDFSMTIFPQVISFLLKMLSDKLQPLRVAALKSIQFFIETLSCTINMAFLQILKEVISTYPTNLKGEINPSRIPYGLVEYEMDEKKKQNQNIESSQINGKNKILIDHYHHLLETLLSLIGQINKRIVQSIFSDIVVPGIVSKQNGNELKLYLLRFAEKAISLSGPDLNIESSLIGILLNFCEQKSSNKAVSNNQRMRGSNRNQFPSANKHIIYNLANFSHKILCIIKVKVLPKYSGTKLENFLEWINKTLHYLGENQLLSNNCQQVNSIFLTLLDFTIALYSNPKYDVIKLKHNPIESILYFTNSAVHQNGLPFNQILECLIMLLKYMLAVDQNCDLDKEIATRILEKSKQHNLSLKELQVLGKILQVANDDSCILEWLQVFLGSIPHSTFDETYWVFSLLIEKSLRFLEKSNRKTQILKKIVKTLLDQYTVKGKAHQEAKETLIACLIRSQQCSIIDLLSVCLFENIEPDYQNYYNKMGKRKPMNVHPKEHKFDSKSYKIDKQLFIEKVSFAQLIITKVETESSIHEKIFSENNILRFSESIMKLAGSRNWKLKNKALSLMSYFIEISGSCWKNLKNTLHHYEKFTLVIRTVFTLAKNLLSSLKDSKLMYSVLYNLMSMFRKFQTDQESDNPTEEHYEKIERLSKAKVNQKIECNKVLLKLFLLKQFLKNFQQIHILSYSPWENVREIYHLLILEVFKDGISYLPQILRKKTMEITKSLMLALFSSNEHSQRQIGLKIFGCLLGLRHPEVRPQKIEEYISHNLRYLKPVTEKVFEMIYDWDEKTSEIAEYLCELCFCRQSQQSMKKKYQQERKSESGMDSSFCSFNLGEEMSLEKRNYSGIGNNLQNLLLRDSWLLDEDPQHLQVVYQPEITEILLNKIVEFRSIIEKEIQNRTEIFGEKQSFLEQNDEQFYDIGEERAESIEARDNKSEEEQLEFEDLGIIELDDEEWGEEEEKQDKITQKLPLKKIYKLSPNVINSSKPQRIRSKRYHQNEFDYREKIIIDELEEGKIETQGNNSKSYQSIDSYDKNPMKHPHHHQEKREESSDIKRENKEKEKEKEWQENKEKQKEKEEKAEMVNNWMIPLEEPILEQNRFQKKEESEKLLEAEAIKEKETESKKQLEGVSWVSTTMMTTKKKKTSKKRKSSLGK